VVRSLLLMVTTTMSLLVACTSGALGAGLPLGTGNLTEARHSQALAPGVTYTDIVRGTGSNDEYFAVDVDFTLNRDEAAQTAARITAEGNQAQVISVDDHAPDSPSPGPAAYMVRVGRYASSAEARPIADRLVREGYPRVHVDYSGDDGTLTGGPWRLHLIDIDPRRFAGSVQPVLATGIVPGRETVSSIDLRTSALAGVNGGYFVIGSSDGTPGDLAGISMISGDLVSEAVNGRTDLLMPQPSGRGAFVAPLSTALSARAADGARHVVNGRNRALGLIRSCGEAGDRPTERPLHDVTCTNPSELVQFTPAFGSVSDPSSQIEAVLDGRGRVVTLRPPGGPIPPSGSVLGGTGDGAAWLRAHAIPGSKLRVSVAITTSGGSKPCDRRRRGGAPRPSRADRKRAHRDPRRPGNQGCGERKNSGRGPAEGAETEPVNVGPTLGIVNGGPRLLSGGAPMIDAAAEGFTHPDDPEFYYRFGVRRNPRTLAGVTPAGHLLLLAVDGRAPGYSNGLSFAEEASVLRSLGASDALNLDGGGSTTMALGPALVTRPSDPTGERPVGDSIVVLPQRDARARAGRSG